MTAEAAVAPSAPSDQCDSRRSCPVRRFCSTRGVRSVLVAARIAQVDSAQPGSQVIFVLTAVDEQRYTDLLNERAEGG